MDFQLLDVEYCFNVQGICIFGGCFKISLRIIDKAKSKLDRYTYVKMYSQKGMILTFLGWWWWRIDKVHYLTLHLIAGDIFAILVSTVVSESTCLQEGEVDT